MGPLFQSAREIRTKCCVKYAPASKFHFAGLKKSKQQGNAFKIFNSAWGQKSAGFVKVRGHVDVIKASATSTTQIHRYRS